MVTKSELEAQNAHLLSEVARLTGEQADKPEHSPAQLAAAEIAGLKAHIELLDREAMANVPSPGL